MANGLAGPTVAWRDAPAPGSSPRDIVFSTRVKILETDAQNATAGIVFRSDVALSGPDHNEYYFGLYPEQGLWKLWKVVDGSFGSYTETGQWQWGIPVATSKRHQ